MRILVADETNNESSEDIKFFIYGGVVFDSDSVKAIGDSIKDIRNNYGIEQNETLKANLKSRPKSLSPEQHTQLKSDIIDLAIEHNVSVIINCVLHDIAKNKEQSDLLEMTSRTVFRRFDDLCSQENAPGIVLADRWPCKNGFEFLEGCHLGEITYSSGASVKLPSIYGFAQVSDNSTTLMCVADIVLGAFRYCINYRDKTNINKLVMPKIAKLLWHTKSGNGTRDIWNKGFSTSPREITHKPYKEEYDALCQHVVEYANSKET